MTNGHHLSKDEYQDHMDDLAKKVGAVLAGQRIEDGIICCAACIGFAMVQLTPEQQAQMRNHVNNMIEEIIKNVRRPSQ